MVISNDRLWPFINKSNHRLNHFIYKIQREVKAFTVKVNVLILVIIYIMRQPCEKRGCELSGKIDRLPRFFVYHQRERSLYL